jgi:hypothetical protein
MAAGLIAGIFSCSCGTFGCESSLADLRPSVILVAQLLTIITGLVKESISANFALDFKIEAPHIAMSVHATALSSAHEFSKLPQTSITLIAGLGVEGDCHAGEFVQHRSRLHIRPKPANLRQVHIQSLEMLQSVNVEPGKLGENVTTQDVDLAKLGRGDRLHFVPKELADGEEWRETPHAVVTVQGLRNPCQQIERYRKGLQEKFIVRNEERAIVDRLAGVMCTVEESGLIAVGMAVSIEPAASFEPLGPV